MKKIILIPVLTVFFLSACQTTNTLYAWGNYESTLFANFHEPDIKEAELQEYLLFLEKHPTSKKKVGPGLYAEAGTFMLELGNVEEAIKFYKLEATNWPPSERVMQTLIKNLESTTNSTAGSITDAE